MSHNETGDDVPDAKPQASIFDIVDAPRGWEGAWRGMPEFKMEAVEPFQKITISFDSQDDVDRFAALVGQNITKKTTWLWFPKREKHLAPSNYRYVDES